MNIHDKGFSTDLMRGQEYFYHHLNSCISSCWKMHVPQDMIATLFTMCYRCTHDKKEVRCFNCGEWLCIICYSIHRSQTFICWKCGSLNNIHDDASIPLTSPEKMKECRVSTTFPDDHLEDELVRAMISHFVELTSTQRITAADELLRHAVPTLMSYDLDTMHDICSRVAEKIDVALSRQYFDDNWNRFATLPRVTEHTAHQDIVRILISSRTNSSQFLSIFEPQKWVPVIQCHVSQCDDEPLEQCPHCGHEFCALHLGIDLTSPDNPMISCCPGICFACRDSIHSRSSCSCHSVSVYTNDESGDVLFHVHAAEDYRVAEINLQCRTFLANASKNNPPSKSFEYGLNLVSEHLSVARLKRSQDDVMTLLWIHNCMRLQMNLDPLFPRQWLHMLGTVLSLESRRDVIRNICSHIPSPNTVGISRWTKIFLTLFMHISNRNICFWKLKRMDFLIRQAVQDNYDAGALRVDSVHIRNAIWEFRCAACLNLDICVFRFRKSCRVQTYLKSALSFQIIHGQMSTEILVYLGTVVRDLTGGFTSPTPSLSQTAAHILVAYQDISCALADNIHEWGHIFLGIALHEWRDHQEMAQTVFNQSFDCLQIVELMGTC